MTPHSTPLWSDRTLDLHSQYDIREQQRSPVLPPSCPLPSILIMQTAQSPASVPAVKRTKRVAGQGDSNPGRAKRNERAEKDKETYPCPFPGCGQSYSRREYLRRHHRKRELFARRDVVIAFYWERGDSGGRALPLVV